MTDENDNAPILEKTEYEFYLTENSPADTVIGRVSAYDLDLGRNAEITYKFAIENDRFEIDKQSGFISSKIVIDRENMATSSEFDIEVIVSDQGLVAQTAVAKVLISILEIFLHETFRDFILGLLSIVVSCWACLVLCFVCQIANPYWEEVSGCAEPLAVERCC